MIHIQRLCRRLRYAKCVLSALILVALLSACQPTPEPETLYQEELAAVELQTSKFRIWAETLVSVIGENNQDLDIAVSLVERDQSENLDEEESVKFDRLQQRIETRRDEITNLFERGELTQFNLFASFYAYFGKLDAGAEFCEHTKVDLSNIKVPGLVNQSSWPELEGAYIDAFREGKQTLGVEGNFQCDVFLSQYDVLRNDVEEEIVETNKLLKSLDF